MTEHPTRKELDEYCRRVLAPATFLSVHRHVITCVRCAAQCNSPQQTAQDMAHLHEALTSAPDETPYHLSASEKMAYARGTLNEIDLEIAESHLGICPTCLKEVQQHAVEAERVAPLSVKPATSKPRQFVIAWPGRVAVVLSAAALILLAVWLLRTRPAEKKEQAAQPINVSSPQRSSTPEVQVSATPPLAQDAQLAVILNDGSGKVTMDGQGTLTGLEQLPARIQQRVKAALQAARLKQPDDLAQLNSAPSTLLSESGNGLPFRLLAPLGQVIRSQQPTFQPLSGAQSYKVIVTDADLNQVTNQPDAQRDSMAAHTATQTGRDLLVAGDRVQK